MLDQLKFWMNLNLIIRVNLITYNIESTRIQNEPELVTRSKKRIYLILRKNAQNFGRRTVTYDKIEMTKLEGSTRTQI
jgi:hypothetical protein